jgi:8-amino-7-oxononanoate synthase
MNGEGWIQPALDELAQHHLRRSLHTYSQAGGRITGSGRTLLNFSSNDYLNFANHPTVVSAARDGLDDYGNGAGASRLVTGTLPLHETLEEQVAADKGYPAALVFGSGFLTNVGVIPALVGRHDTVFADKLVHASMIDAIILSRAKLVRFRHNDPEHLAELLEKQRGNGRCLVVTESVFSMDGDVAPLVPLSEIAQNHDAMFMVDEAHATGIFGETGGGLVSQLGLQDHVNVAMGTFSKALGNYGGMIACSTAMKQWLVNRARAFIYTTALPPAILGGCLGALQVIRNEPGLGSTLLERVNAFRNQLQQRGFDTGQSRSQIVPIMIGDSERALALSAALSERGILAVAIRPPTVPQDTARLRLSVTLAHSPEDLSWTIDQLTLAAKELGVL